MKKYIWILICLAIIGSMYYILVNYRGSTKIVDAKSSTVVKEVKGQNMPGSNYFFETFDESDLKIKEIGLFSSSDAVLKAFGNPRKKKQESRVAINNPDYNEYIDTWIYPGITIQLSTSIKKGNSPPEKPSQVSGIILTNSNYETRRGIRIEDSIIKLFEKYGQVSLEDNYYGYQVDLVYIRFLVANEKVIKIEIGGMVD